jgi:hypothetical protein
MSASQQENPISAHPRTTVDDFISRRGAQAARNNATRRIPYAMQADLKVRLYVFLDCGTQRSS